MHSAAAADGKQTASSGADSETMSSKIKILVVDDQMAVALMMVFLLRRAGFDAQAALNAEKALRLAQTEVFDLITLDIGIPDLDGFGLFQKLKLEKIK